MSDPFIRVIRVFSYRLTGLSLPNALSSTYTYDAAGRLTLLAHSTLTETVASYAYELDQLGNRRVLTESLVTVQSLAGGTYLEEQRVKSIKP